MTRRLVAVLTIVMGITTVPAAIAQDAERRVAELRLRGAYDEAIATARRVGLHNALGELLVLTGRPDEAGRAFAAAIAERRSDSLTAHLNLAILRYDRGERETARRSFDGFIDLYNRGRRLSSSELSAVGTAVQYLSIYDPQLAHDALRAYDEAVRADPENLEPRLRLGELFLRRYNGTDARQTFDEILASQPDHPEALLGMARTLRFEGSRRAVELVKQSLERNPNLVAARVFLAELLIELERYDEAEREIAHALDVSPISLAALSVRAAIAYLRGDETRFTQTTRRVLTLNPTYADLYATLAEVSARNRLYDQAARFAQDGVRLDSVAWRAYALLGINQLRNGVMDSGRANLETAFAGDPFDIWTKNTLDLLDTLERYPETTSGRFRFYIDGSESELLTLYVAPLAEAAYDSLSARYRYSPATPIRIEVYPDHADFSVRTIGLVGLGALGVSFGPVVAMDSPSARRRGEFNWGSTLWHEIAHTFHLGLTNHRVPRWLTEGLAVYEERRARPGWGDDLTPAYLTAYKQERLLPVSRLNDGFMRPAYPQQISFSYYEASLVCELIEEEFGLDAIMGLLHAYRDGLDTPAAFRRVLGTEITEFDERFDRWFRRRFAGQLAAIVVRDSSTTTRRTRTGIVDRARRNPGEFLAQLAMGQMLLRDDRPDEALEYLERAKRLFPDYAGPDSPYWLLSRIHKERGRLARAAAELEAFTRINERSYEAYVELAEMQLALHDEEGALEALDRAIYVHPSEPGLHNRLAELAERLGRTAMALRERRAVLALDPVDRAEALYQLARVHLLGGDRDAARRAVLRALEEAPAFEKAQDLLLEIVEGR